MSEVKVSNVLDYRQNPALKPYYRMNRILPLSGSPTAPLSTTGGNEVIFELPVSAFNLAQSIMYFDMYLPEARAAGPVSDYTWVWRDVLPMIRTIQLYTRGGVYLCDLNFVHNMTKIVNKAETKLDDFLCYDASVGAILANIGTAGTVRTLRRLNVDAGAGQRHDNTPSNVPFTEPLYLQVSAVANGAGAGNLALRYKFPLSEIKNTIFEFDKLIYAGEVLVLRIVFEGLPKIAYAGTANNNPTTGATAYPLAAQVVQNNFPIQITNLTLYLAVERNEEIVNQLKNKVMSDGLHLLIPYTTGYSIALTGTVQTISLRFNRGNGRRLLKVYTTSFNINENLNTAYDNSNVTGATAKVTEFYTMLDNQRLQEFNLVCSNYDDWMLIQKKLAGSVIQSSSIYHYNWFWVDDFTESENLFEKNFNQEVGLSLDVERKYDVYLTTNGALNNGDRHNYAYATFLKMLSITSAGITMN